MHTSCTYCMLYMLICQSFIHASTATTLSWPGSLWICSQSQEHGWYWLKMPVPLQHSVKWRGFECIKSHRVLTQVSWAQFEAKPHNWSSYDDKKKSRMISNKQQLCKALHFTRFLYSELKSPVKKNWAHYEKTESTWWQPVHSMEDTGDSAANLMCCKLPADGSN